MDDIKTNTQHRKKSSRAHILVVEDDHTGRLLIGSILKKLECMPDFAFNGQEAIEVLRDKQNFYDVIFMDCMMPLMDGYSAIGEIRSHAWGEHIVIISLSANTMPGDHEKCLSAGANDYMRKPVRFDAVAEMLNRYLGPLKA